MENINWNYPTTIWFGVDRIIEIQKACEELNIQKPLIVTDNGILKTNIINKLYLIVLTTTNNPWGAFISLPPL